MRRRHTPDTIARLLRSRSDLRDPGREDPMVAAEDATRLHRVRRGWYVDRDAWQRLFTEDRHALHVHAVARDIRGQGVISHVSAAVLHGLDLARVHPGRVHVTTPPGARVSSGDDVMRHCTPLGPHDVTEVHGIRCTSLARTVFGVACAASPDTALVIADGAERLVATTGSGWDPDLAEQWRRGLAERIARAAGARGIRRARWVAGFADGRAETTLESISRLQLRRLGFQRVRLQVPVAAPAGRDYRVDFGLDDVDAWGECDGAGKYLDEAQRSGRSPEQVLLDEKRREDWIRGTTGRRILRWEHRHVTSAAALAAHLSAFGITIPR